MSPGTPAGREPGQVAASTLIGDKVKSRSGSPAGLVYDVLLDGATGDLAQLVVSLGTILEAGDDLRYVPWSEVEIDWTAQSLVVPLNAEELARGPAGPSGERGTRSLGIQSVLGAKVENSIRESLGKIEELVIDLRRARIAYAVLSYGGILGIGGKLFAIPWKALAAQPSGDGFLFNIAQEVLDDAPGFDAEEWDRVPRAGEWGRRGQRHHGFER